MKHKLTMLFITLALVTFWLFVVLAVSGCYWPYYQYREFDPITGNKTKEETLGIYTVAIVGERQDIEGQTANMLLTVKNSKHKPDPNTIEAAVKTGGMVLIPAK